VGAGVGAFVAGTGESGKGDREDHVVVLGGAGGLDGWAAGGAGFDAELGEFAEKGEGEGEGLGDAEGLLLGEVF